MVSSPTINAESARPLTKRKRVQLGNPLQRGIHSFLLSHASSSRSTAPTSQTIVNSDAANVVDPATLPKRYTLYPPLLLLPASFPTHPSICSLSASDLPALYTSIQHTFSPITVTHIALQAPIPPSTPTPTPTSITTSPIPNPNSNPAFISATSSNSTPLSSTSLLTTPNITRRPTNLIPLHGPWPTTTTASSTDDDDDDKEELWVHHTEPSGITQTWAPRHTMFSRGNVREKARIVEGRVPDLGLLHAHAHARDLPSKGGGGEGEAAARERRRLRPVGDMAVLDMYVGIGYFAFSFLRAGVKRVWGWEINRWSVEGARRGAGENGWGVEVVAVSEEGEVEVGREGEGGVEGLVRRMKERDIAGATESEGEGVVRLVVFQGNNCWAGQVMRRVRDAWGEGWDEIAHANLGLLPRSRLAWGTAVEVLGWDGGGGWAHAHENVEEEGIEQRRQEVVGAFQALCDNMGWGGWVARCEHVERVKTYAPGVIHCVFDVEIEPTTDNVEPSRVN